MGSTLQNINSSTSVFALHGFLGSGQDFQPIAKDSAFQLIAPNLFQGNDFDLSSFEAVATKIADQMKNTAGKKIFVGYSLGGRIGLHLLKLFPESFDHYVFLSTHPGLNSENEMSERKANDLLWLQKLQKLPWTDFLIEWNSQPVFVGSSEPQRVETDFNKNQLEKALSNLSLSQQQNMSDIILNHKSKITWVVGAKDLKFVSLAEDLKQKKILESYSRIFSGHRILFDAQAEELQKLISKLL